MTDQFCELPNGIRLCYRVHGKGEPLLLVAGLGMQLIFWPRAMIAGLVDAGFQVITFDNRDVGRSTHLETPPPSRLRLFFRRSRPDSYDLVDMAGDAAGLLEHLQIDAAHVAGMSMGGMIAQEMAALHARRVRTLTSIFSTTGSLWVGQPAWATMRQMMTAPSQSSEQSVENYLTIMRLIAGAGHPLDEAEAARYAAEAWDRDGIGGPPGVARQVAAIVKSGNRTARVRTIKTPTLVIHGDRDPMVATSGGRATAAAIEGARLKIIPGMGHDLADGVIGHIVEEMVSLARGTNR